MGNFRDDHMARRIDLVIDGLPVKSVTNDGITASVSLDHKWDTRSLSKGVHKVEWMVSDDYGNVLVDTWLLTVQ